MADSKGSNGFDSLDLDSADFGSSFDFDDDEFSTGGQDSQSDAFANTLKQSGVLSNNSQSQGQGNESSDDYGALSQVNNQAESNVTNRKEMKKSTLMIIFGIVAIIIAFIIVSSLSGKNKSNNGRPKQQSNTSNANVVQQVQNNTDGWSIVRADTQIAWQKNKIDSIFTITDIKHYVKVLDGNNLMIKSRLTGTLSGFVGTYELDIPFSTSINEIKPLEIGDYFNVKVEVGLVGDKKVIGEISYN